MDDIKDSWLLKDQWQKRFGNAYTAGVDAALNADPGSTGMFSGLGDMLSNKDLMSSVAGLGSTLAQFAALPSQIDWAKTNTQALKQNIATAREEQARRNKNISGFNSIDASRYA